VSAHEYKCRLGRVVYRLADRSSGQLVGGGEALRDEFDTVASLHQAEILIEEKMTVNRIVVLFPAFSMLTRRQQMIFGRGDLLLLRVIFWEAMGSYYVKLMLVFLVGVT
jgi:hypothetical protein